MMIGKWYNHGTANIWAADTALGTAAPAHYTSSCPPLTLFSGSQDLPRWKAAARSDGVLMLISCTVNSSSVGRTKSLVIIWLVVEAAGRFGPLAGFGSFWKVSGHSPSRDFFFSVFMVAFGKIKFHVWVECQKRRLHLVRRCCMCNASQSYNSLCMEVATLVASHEVLKQPQSIIKQCVKRQGT